MDFDPFAPPPERIGGRYRLGEVIGEGGCGVVYQVTDEQTGELLAAKLVETSTIHQPLRFLAEARDMARIQHPRVVRVLAAGRDGRWYWTVMELMRGGSLKDLVEREGPCDPMTALKLIFRVLQGLSVVHASSLIHRDIKPHNILLDDRGDPKIADFGLARHAEGDVPYKTRTGESLGSPSYRSPEQTNNPTSAGREADVYGVGATLYFLLKGEKPPVFFAISDDDLVAATKDLPPAIVEIIRRATAYRPCERYRTALEMASAVAHVYDDLPERQGHPKVAERWLSRFDSNEEEQRPASFWRWLRARIG